MNKEVPNMKHTANVGVGIVLFLGLAAIPASAQSQAPSNTQQGQPLGDYARQIRKGPEAKSKARVFDNDNLPTQDKLSVVGNATTSPEPAPEQKPADADGTASAAGPEGKPSTANPPADTSKMDQAAKEAAWKQWGDKIKAQQDTIDLANRELDVLQREYQIRAAAMYADAGNRLRNSADWDKQDAQYKQQIADKQKAVDDAKQKLEDLQEEARKAGVPSSVREP
jgi:hypothetical protein